MWPTYQTIENRLLDRDSYSWKYGRLSCRLWLTARGRFYGQIDRWPVVEGWDFREILDKMYSSIPRGAR